jgi:hypothetical protein
LRYKSIQKDRVIKEMVKTYNELLSRLEKEEPVSKAATGAEAKQAEIQVVLRRFMELEEEAQQHLTSNPGSQLNSPDGSAEYLGRISDARDGMIEFPPCPSCAEKEYEV